MEENSKKFNLALSEYKNFLKQIDFSKKNTLNENMIVKLLMYRDSLDSFWNIEFEDKSFEKNKDLFIKLSKEIEDLDSILIKNSPEIIKVINLDKWREKFKPSNDAWWWFLEEKAKKFSFWYKLDSLWNIFTAVSLAISASFMISIYASVSMGDANFATALSTIAQIMGLAVIGGGALSNKGQIILKNGLSKLHIPSKFFAEATMVIALLFMYSASYINDNLDDYYMKKGMEAYHNGDLSDAIGYMLQAKEMNPSGTKYDGLIGKAYESLGHLNQASLYYLQSIENGNYKDLNSLGRVFVNKQNPITGEKNRVMAESYLLLALQRLQTHKNSENLMYRVRTNMGWALLEQKKYDRAKAYLEVALYRQNKIIEDKNRTKVHHSNMASCFMAQIYKETNATKKSSKMWLKCIDDAKPEFVHQYAWFMKIKQEKIAYCIDTSNVVSGYNSKRNKFSKDFCDTVKEELKANIK